MSVLIKGLEMPETCLECIKSGFRTAIHCAEWTEISAGLREHTRSLSCPLEEVPTPHGRLVEFIDVIARVNEDDGTEEVCVGDVFKAYYEMKNAPTVIEAEE